MQSAILRVIIASFFFMSQIAHAQIINPSGQNQASGSEYFVGKQLGQPLITVNLINGVSRPGVYHVPLNTNIAQLLAYAGGAREKSNLAAISIQREKSEKRQLVPVDLDKIIRSTSSIPKVSDKDIIHIAEKPSLDETMKWMSLISIVTSIGLSVALFLDIQER